MFNGLSHFLGNVFHGAQQGAQNIEHGIQGAAGSVGHAIQGAVQQGVSNAQANFSHPQNLVQQPAHAVQQLWNNITYHAPNNSVAPQGRFPIVAPHITSPLNTYGPTNSGLPTEFNNIVGQLALQHDASSAGFKPGFMHDAQQTNPQVAPHSYARTRNEAGDYNPRTNQITQYGLQNNGVIQHEALHSEFQHMSPAQQKSYEVMAQNNISPDARYALQQQLRGPLYQNHGSMANIAQLPFRYATEAHSYLPAMEENMSPALMHYYQQYMQQPEAAQSGYGFNHGQTNVVDHLLNRYNYVLGDNE